MVGPSKHIYIYMRIDTHTRAQCSHASVGLAQACPNHGYCSIAYLACLLIWVGGTVISCDREVINDRQDMEEGGTWEGKRSGGWEKVNKMRIIGERYLLTWTVCDQISF